jgi:hypothetical protein
MIALIAGFFVTKTKKTAPEAVPHVIRSELAEEISHQRQAMHSTRKG